MIFRHKELLDYIQDNYTASSVQSYDSARDILYEEIDNVNGYVYCVYTVFLGFLGQPMQS